MTDQPEIEEVLDWTPPSAERVARRALVLAAVVCRSGIEPDAGNQQAETFRGVVVKWLEALGLIAEAEPAEIEFLKKPMGSLDPREKINGSWRTEALAVLSWSLGRYDLPAYDAQADGPAAGLAIGFLQEGRETILEQPRLRPPDEIEKLADTLFLAQWRLRQFLAKPEPIDFEELAGASFGPVLLEGLRLRERDLEIGDVQLWVAPEKSRQDGREHCPGAAPGDSLAARTE